MSGYSDEQLLGLIQEVAEQHLGHTGTLTPDTRIVEALSLDSVRLLTLVVELENRLELCLDDVKEALAGIGGSSGAVRDLSIAALIKKLMSDEGSRAQILALLEQHKADDAE